MDSDKVLKRIQLLLAKVELIKLKSANGGYDFAILGKDGQKLVKDTLAEIEGLLK